MRKIFQRLYYNLPVIRELRRIEDALNRIKVNEMIRLLDFDLHNHPRYGDPRRLLSYQSQVCSQSGEDGIIHEIFRRIGVETHIFAEIGVGNGIENNTAFLLSQGWTGYWIDSDSGFLKEIKNKGFPKDCVEYLVAFVDKDNISRLFEQLGIPTEFDLLSLDIDQNTYYVWDGLQRYRPRVVVVEYNSTIPADLDWKVHYDPHQTWNGTKNFGASLKAFELLGRTFGYSLVGCDFHGVNAFFVRDDLLADKFVEPYTSENHYEPARYSMFPQRSYESQILDRITPG